MALVITPFIFISPYSRSKCDLRVHLKQKSVEPVPWFVPDRKQGMEYW